MSEDRVTCTKCGGSDFIYDRECDMYCRRCFDETLTKLIENFENPNNPIWQIPIQQHRTMIHGRCD